MARLAVRQPFRYAYSAIAEPSSWATLPKLNASLPALPKRFGPIWSVPMHGAIVSLPGLDRLLDDRRREVDVAGREHDVRALAEQLRRARLRLRGVVVVRVAGLDLERPSLDAALRVDLADADLRRRERRPVERRHVALAVERPADHDRRRPRSSRSRRAPCRRSRPRAPPLRAAPRRRPTASVPSFLPPFGFPVQGHDSSFALIRRYSVVCSGTGTPSRSASRTSEPVISSISVGRRASTSSSMDG